MISDIGARWAIKDAAFLNPILAGKAEDMLTSGSLAVAVVRVECKTKECGEGRVQQSACLGLDNSSIEDNLLFVTCYKYQLACLVQVIFWSVSARLCDVRYGDNYSARRC